MATLSRLSSLSAGARHVKHFKSFGELSFGFRLDAKEYQVRLEAKLGHKKEWSPILGFTLHAWRIIEPEHFITYENTTGIISEEDRQAVQMDLELAQIGWQVRFAHMSPGKKNEEAANLPTTNEAESGS